MTKIHVNVAYPRVDSESLKYISESDLHLEFYFCAKDLDELVPGNIAKLKKEIEEYNFSVTVHAPFYDLNLGAFDAGIRNVTVDRLMNTLDVASELGAKIVVVHPGYWPFKSASDRNDWLNNAREGVAAIVKKAEKLNIKIAFENIFDRMPDDLKELVLMASSKNVGVCFDIGHYNMFSALPMREWFEKLGEYIIECHIHDNDETADQHKPLGTGTLDFVPFVDWYKALPAASKPLITIEHQTRNYIPITLAYLKGVGI
jgi:sugar phosphate isomerase/epimerase